MVAVEESQRGSSMEGCRQPPIHKFLVELHEILQTEVNFMVLSHNRNVIAGESAFDEGTDVAADDGNDRGVDYHASLTPSSLVSTTLCLTALCLTFLPCVTSLPCSFLAGATNRAPASNFTASC